MNQKSNTAYRLIALFIAFSFLPALLFGSQNEKKSEKDLVIPLSESLISVEYDIHQHPAAIITEELLRDHITRISQNHNPKRSGQSDTFQFYLINNFLLVAAAYILFILIKLRRENKNYSLLFIINYIHNQDGYKIHNFFY